MRLELLITIMMLMATSAVAQMPTTPNIASGRDQSLSASSEQAAAMPLVVQAERYDRTMVAPDTLSAVIDTLNDPTHERAYQAALSEIRETLVKQRVAALIMIYKQRIIQQAVEALGVVSNLQDPDQQARIYLKALEMHHQPLELPALPPGFHTSGMPKTPASILQSQQKLQR